MKKLFLLHVIVLFLPACANLEVTEVSVTWSETTKKATATITNLPALIPFFSRTAENFAVTFDPSERPASGGAALQIRRTVPSLNPYDSITMEADFTPLANPTNYQLWNVFKISVTADPDEVVPEGSLFRSNNVKDIAVPFSSDLPIVVIDTLGATVPNEPKIPAQMKIIYDYQGGRNFVDEMPNDYKGRIGIETRGASSASFCQKQYGFETWNASNNDINVSLLQFPSESDWIWHGPYNDKTLLRNYLAYATSNSIGRYASRTKFVETLLNDPGLARPGCPTPPPDQYVGVYLLMEKIKRDTNRVAVEKLTVSDNSEPQVTGGYILKIDWPDPNDVSFTTPSAVTVRHVYPKASTIPAENDITAQQRQWIQDYVIAFDDALNSASFTDPITGYAKYIDVDSFVDYFILQELFKNFDAFRASAYMHKPRNEKLRMGPIWDFNLSMGLAFDAPHSDSAGWILGNNSGQPAWWTRLLTDGNFKQKIVDRWQALRTSSLSTSTLLATIDAGATQLHYAQARHFNRWPILGTSVFGTPTPPPPNESHASVVQDLKTWIQARAIWIDSNIASLSP